MVRERLSRTSGLLETLCKGDRHNINTFSRLVTDMDDKSLEMLEFPKIREILAGFTSFSGSKELALILKPSADAEQVSLGLRESAEARRLLAVRPGFSVGDIMDVRQSVRMAATGRVLDPIALVGVQKTLVSTRILRTGLARVSTDFPTLWGLGSQIIELKDLEVNIARCIASTGEILDSASVKLAGLRQRSRQVRRELLDRLQSFIGSTKGQKIVQEPIVTERAGRFVIPIKVESRKDLKGFVHDVSNSGATVFVEPMMTLEQGNELRQVSIEERQEIERILAELSAYVGANGAEISINVFVSARLDLALAKARYAESVKGIEPTIDFAYDARSREGVTTNGVLRLVNARHPLLKGRVVPLSVEIGRDCRVLVISGPNTGGKTVALKAMGLMALMAQAGIPIPVSEGTCLPLFDNVFADIGDEQSIEHTLSTFSSHMGNIVRIINCCSRNSLVLLDELGASTDPNEGTALARAILLHFKSMDTMAVATTHYGDVKIAAHTTPGLRNASLDFDPTTLTPTYHLTLGIPGESNAFAVAALLGLPGEIVSAARELQSKGVQEIQSVLRDLAAERQKLADMRSDMKRQHEEAEGRQRAAEAECDQLREQAQAGLHEMRTLLVPEVAELQRQIRQAAADLKKAKSRAEIERARETITGFHAWLDANERVAGIEPARKPGPDAIELNPGDRVWLSDVGIWGTVATLFPEERQLEVLVGNARLRINLQEVEKASSPKPAEGGQAIFKASPRQHVSSLELDLRGKRADEIETQLDAYLNEAFLAHLPQVRIIHGIGAGTVRQIVRETLSSHPLLKSFRPGRRGEGGDGVTMVNMALETH